MNDHEIESLLRRYRPISTFPHLHISKSTWPWAVAAAALLAISVGLHAAVVPAPDLSSAVDAQRVRTIAEALGGSPGSEDLAEWMARREARVELEARLNRAAAPEIDRR
jgi:hypothetical protein